MASESVAKLVILLTVYILALIMSDVCRAMLGNPQPSAGAVHDVNSSAPEVENYEVLSLSC